MLEREATYKESNKRGRSILVDGENFEYRYNKENKNTVYYLCRKRIAYACTATAFVKKGQSEKCYVKRVHNHGSDIKEGKIEDIIKENLRSSAPFGEVPVRNVVSNICRTAEDQGLGSEHLPSTSTLKMRIHRARKAFTVDPPIPKVY